MSEDRMKFTRKDTPTIMDGMVVRYQCGDFEINASRNGVSMNGHCPMIRDFKDVEVASEYLRRAFLQFKALEPNAMYLHSRTGPLTEEQIDRVFDPIETR